jgi:HlyD family secretion protein
VVAYVYLGGGEKDEQDKGEVYFSVASGQLTISVTEAGTIKPRDQVVIKSELEGRATILYLIPEGKRVKKGDLLVELDTSSLIDSKVDQEIRVQNAEASYLQSKENLAVVQNQAEADVDKAELALRFAKEDLTKYKEGDYPNKLNDLNGRIVLAKEDVARTEKELENSEKLYQEKYISKTELDGDRLAVTKAGLDLKLAESNLRLLKDFTYRRQVDQLNSDVKQAEMALERIKRKASADIVQAETTLRARESEFRRQKSKLEKIEEQIGKAKILAPTDGSVVYATSAQFSWRGNVEPLDEGQEVRERQELIYLPTASTFMAEVNIHEASLKKIYTGLPVRLTVDALPGRRFTGKVARIAPLPDARSMFMNPDLKVYKTDIDVDGGGDVLRTGMTCQVEIVVEQHDDTLYVPVQSVVRVGGKPVVYVHEGDQDVQREVEIGLDNNRMVRIVKGVEKGEQVLLTPPLAVDGGGVATEDVPKMEIPDRPAEPKMKKGGEAAPKPTGEAGTQDGGGQRDPEQMRKMRERFQNMTPEEREKARAEWQRRSQNGEGGGGRRPRGEGGGAPRQGGAPRGGGEG